MTRKIRNIIFDFGDIFINLDKEAPLRGIFNIFPDFVLDQETDLINKKYEKGLVDTREFVDHYLRKLPETSVEQLKSIWNSIILDIPERRIEFLESLNRDHNYRLFLLSNTNSLHMEQVLVNTGADLFNRFKSQFEKFYLSHEIGMRKPDREIYTFVLRENRLEAGETLFVDDLAENTGAASKLGLLTWNLDPEYEDVTQLFSKELPL